ncbi:MAG: hypothetical protein RIT27_104 [Pseudomonadota bacterium]|jgi:hypothetical protein
MSRLYEMAKNRVVSAKNWVVGGLVSVAVLASTSAQAANECTSTTGICSKLVSGMGGMFTDITELSIWLVLGLLGIAFIFFAFYKISGASKRT